MGREREGKAGQAGMTIVLVLFFLVVATLFGAVSLRKVKGEINGTKQNVMVTRAKYVAEAAVYVGLAVVKGTPGYTCVTHRPDGTTRAAGPGSCATADLSRIPSLYRSAVSLESGTGWLIASPADTADALTGSLTERVRVKIWMPAADSVRVVGRASVNGVDQDVQLFGNY